MRGRKSDDGEPQASRHRELAQQHQLPTACIGGAQEQSSPVQVAQVSRDSKHRHLGVQSSCVPKMLVKKHRLKAGRHKAAAAGVA